MAWDEIIGHRWAAAALKQHVSSGSLRHAYLLSGPAHIGKRTLALAFGSAILCPNPPEPGVPCGTCDECRHSAAGSHPDMHLLRVAEDAAAIGIDQARELQSQIALSPYQADHRVVLIEEAAQLTTAASNALLKTLEEPPPNVVLILMAESTEQLLTTITSRCMQIPLRPVSSDEIESALSRISQDSQAVALATALSSGRPGIGLALLQEQGALQKRVERIRELLSLIDADLPGRFAYVADCLSEKTRLENARIATQLLEDWLSVWRDVLLVRTDAGGATANPDFRDAVRGLSERVSAQEIMRVLASIRTSLAVLKAYGNPDLALEVVLLDTPG